MGQGRNKSVIIDDDDLQPHHLDGDDDYDRDDDFYDLDDDGDKYDSEGNVVWSAAYEGSFVDLKCLGCGSHFRGMPDHGYCGTCADIRERGGELPGDGEY